MLFSGVLKQPVGLSGECGVNARRQKAKDKKKGAKKKGKSKTPQWACVAERIVYRD